MLVMKNPAHHRSGTDLTAPGTVQIQSLITLTANQDSSLIPIILIIEAIDGKSAVGDKSGQLFIG
jgi:hypothetical protein